MQEKYLRVISSIILIPLLLYVLITGGTILKIGISFITGVALYEYINTYKNTDNKVISPVLFIGYVLSLFVVFTNQSQMSILLLIYLVALLSLAFPIFSKRYNVISSAITITGYIYIVTFFFLLYIYIILKTAALLFGWYLLSRGAVILLPIIQEDFLVKARNSFVPGLALRKQ